MQSAYFNLRVFKNIRAVSVLVILLFSTNQFLAQKLRVSDIVFEGLKKTKPQIVDREVTFNKGDELTKEELDAALIDTQKNIQNLSLFVDYNDEIISLEGNSVMVLITLVERYYTYPSPIFKFEEPNFSTWLRNFDFDRTSYGLGLVQKNMRGRNETMVIKAQLGFTKKVSLSYSVPYINRAQKIGASFVTSLIQNDDVVYRTDTNERVFYTDSLQKTKEESFVGIGFTFRPAFNAKHELYAGYRFIRIADSLALLNENYLVPGRSELDYMTLSYRLRLNNTSSDSYPLEGWSFDLRMIKYGLGIANTDVNVLTVRPTLKKYWKLSDRYWIHSGMSLKYSLYDQLPYRIQEGLGFGETLVRGYEFYVIDGQHYGLLRNNLKVNIIKPKTKTLGFIKKAQFRYFKYGLYCNIFSDFGYVEYETIPNGLNNTLRNTLLSSVGIGLDFVTSYDKVFRLEYTVNDRKEAGLYISYRLSI